MSESGDTEPLELEHGDAFDALAALSDGHGHAAVVDYPWTFAEEHGTERFGNQGETDHEFDAFGTEDHGRLSALLDELARTLASGSWTFIFADDDVYPEFRRMVDGSPLTRRRTLVWDRQTIGMGAYFRSRHTFIIPATVGDTDRKVRDRPSVIEAVRQDGVLRENDYPTAKPVELYRKLLAPPVLDDGETLLEPFCGSGPGAAVAAERDIGYWGCDVSDEAIERTQERLNQTSMREWFRGSAA